MSPRDEMLMARGTPQVQEDRILALDTRTPYTVEITPGFYVPAAFAGYSGKGNSGVRLLVGGNGAPTEREFPTPQVQVDGRIIRILGGAAA